MRGNELLDYWEGGWINNRVIQSFLTTKCKCYINVELSSNNCRVNKKWTNEKSYTYTVHQCFYVETQSGRKPWNYFSYMSLRITFIGSTNFLCFPTATGRRLQPLNFSGYNLCATILSPRVDINLIYHSPMVYINEKMNNHTHTQYTNVLRGNPKQEKTTEYFFLCVFKNYLHWKHQLPLFSSCNWKEAPTP